MHVFRSTWKRDVQWLEFWQNGLYMMLNLGVSQVKTFNKWRVTVYYAYLIHVYSVYVMNFDSTIYKYIFCICE